MSLTPLCIARPLIKPCGQRVPGTPPGAGPPSRACWPGRGDLKQLRGRFGADVPLRSLGRPLPLARRRSERHLHSAHRGN